MTPLSDAGCQRRAGDTQHGKRPKAEDEHRVQNDVGDGTAQQGGHRFVHAANGLEQLFKAKFRHDDRGKEERNAGIPHAEGNDGFIASEKPQKAGHHGDADNGSNQAVQDGKDQAVGGGGIGTAAVPRAGIQRDQGVDADAEANGNGVDHVLHRVHQRKRRHGLLTDLGNKKTVHNVVQRVHCHGKHHGQRHGNQQRENRPLFHKSIVHG